MSAHEELEEQAHHAREPFDKRVAATTAVIAALLAIISVLGQLLTTRVILHQQEASDQWAYSQAKDIRHYVAQVAKDELDTLKGNPAVVARYADDDKRYRDDTTNIQEKAREFEKERDAAEKKAFRMHVGEVFLEVSIVLSSLAILTRRNLLWFTGIAGAAIGSLIALTSLFA